MLVLNYIATYVPEIFQVYFLGQQRKFAYSSIFLNIHSMNLKLNVVTYPKIYFPDSSNLDLRYNALIHSERTSQNLVNIGLMRIPLFDIIVVLLEMMMTLSIVYLVIIPFLFFLFLSLLSPRFNLSVNRSHVLLPHHLPMLI